MSERDMSELHQHLGKTVVSSISNGCLINAIERRLVEQRDRINDLEKCLAHKKHEAESYANDGKWLRESLQERCKESDAYRRSATTAWWLFAITWVALIVIGVLLT